jgi:hypothetical protein
MLHSNVGAFPWPFSTRRFNRYFLAVSARIQVCRSCIVVSALCLKISGRKVDVHGMLWNALNPSLIERANLLVLNQKVRRGAVVSGVSGKIISRTNSRIPKDWLALQSAVAPLMHFRRILENSKAFSFDGVKRHVHIFFTFQGNMEAALSTFDCSDGFLRKSPNGQVRCQRPHVCPHAGCIRAWFHRVHCCPASRCHADVAVPLGSRRLHSR